MIHAQSITEEMAFEYGRSPYEKADFRFDRGLIESDQMQGLGFGFIIDIACQTINVVETRKYDPSLPLAFKLAQIFDQPIEAIFTPT